MVDRDEGGQEADWKAWILAAKEHAGSYLRFFQSAPRPSLPQIYTPAKYLAWV